MIIDNFCVLNLFFKQLTTLLSNFVTFFVVVNENLKKIDSQNVIAQMDDFESRIFTQTQYNYTFFKNV